MRICPQRAAVSACAVLVAVLAANGCASKPPPGVEVVACGPLYELRARQVSSLREGSGGARVYIEASDEYAEKIPNLQINLASATGTVYVKGAPREFGFTDAHGNLIAEWHAPESGGAERETLTIRAVDLPGDCVLHLSVAAS